jgi:hypothetical protein
MFFKAANDCKTRIVKPPLKKCKTAQAEIVEVIEKAWWVITGSNRGPAD